MAACVEGTLVPLGVVVLGVGSIGTIDGVVVADVVGCGNDDAVVVTTIDTGVACNANVCGGFEGVGVVAGWFASRASN